MINQELLKTVKQLEIKTRNLVNTVFTGEYHSKFKGTGIEFDEVRHYQPGDDIRAIDWKVTAKMGDPYIKTFQEDRELTVLLLVDISQSGDIGTHTKTKLQIAAEISAILGFSAINNNDKVGLILFSDTIETYIPPKKGKDHILRIIRDIFYKEAQSPKTCIKKGLDFLLKTTKKKAIVFLISDFMDDGYQKSLQIASRKHELIPIIIEDTLENQLPEKGWARFEDPETGECVQINFSNPDIQDAYRTMQLARVLEQDRLFQSIKSAPIRIKTDTSYVDPLVQYFKKGHRA